MYSQLGSNTYACSSLFGRSTKVPSGLPCSTIVRLFAIVKPTFLLTVPQALVPEHPSPKQVRQILGVSPSNIVIAGDSAGGNLALQLVSQLLHPHPSLPILRLPHPVTNTDADTSSSEFPEPFGGMLLISPWAEFNADTPSFTRNRTRDMMPVPAYQIFTDIVLQGVTPELRHYFEPGLTPRGWWSGLGWVFPRVLITSGEYEVMVDQIQRMAAVIAEQVQDMTMFVLPGGVHENFIDAFPSGEGETYHTAFISRAHCPSAENTRSIDEMVSRPKHP